MSPAFCRRETEGQSQGGGPCWDAVCVAGLGVAGCECAQPWGLPYRGQVFSLGRGLTSGPGDPGPTTRRASWALGVLSFQQECSRSSFASSAGVTPSCSLGTFPHLPSRRVTSLCPQSLPVFPPHLGDVSHHARRAPRCGRHASKLAAWPHHQHGGGREAKAPVWSLSWPAHGTLSQA